MRPYPTHLGRSHITHHTYTVGWRTASLAPHAPSRALNTKVVPSIHLWRSKRDSPDVGNATVLAQGSASLPWPPVTCHPSGDRRDCRPQAASPRLDPGLGVDLVKFGAIWWQKQAVLARASPTLLCFAPFIFSNWMHALGGSIVLGGERGREREQYLYLSSQISFVFISSYFECHGELMKTCCASATRGTTSVSAY